MLRPIFLALLVLTGLPAAASPDAGRPDAGAVIGWVNSATATTTPGCPARDRIREGTRCSGVPAAGCWYPNGSSCGCVLNQCISPAGPIPGCVAAERWVCRRDGCPVIPPSGRCSHEGQTCPYDDGMCSNQSRCVRGKWTAQMGQCRP